MDSAHLGRKIMLYRSSISPKTYITISLLTFLIIDLGTRFPTQSLSTIRMRRSKASEKSHIREQCNKNWWWWRKSLCDLYKTKENLVFTDNDLSVLASIEKHAAHVINESLLLLKNTTAVKGTCENGRDGHIGVYVQVGKEGAGGMGIVGGNIIGGKYGGVGNRRGMIDRNVVVKGINIKGKVILKLDGLLLEEKNGLKDLDVFQLLPFEVLSVNIDEDVGVQAGLVAKCACVYDGDDVVVCDEKGEREKSDLLLNSDVRHVRKMIANEETVSEDTVSSLFQLAIVPKAFE